jgi:hypothetical protein
VMSFMTNFSARDGKSLNVRLLFEKKNTPPGFKSRMQLFTRNSCSRSASKLQRILSDELMARQRNLIELEILLAHQSMIEKKPGVEIVVKIHLKKCLGFAHGHRVARRIDALVKSIRLDLMPLGPGFGPFKILIATIADHGQFSSSE